MTRRSILAIALCLTVTACASIEPLKPFDFAGQVWPAPPEKERIAYVTEFSSSRDLGIRPGVWARLVSVVVGSHTDAMVRPMAVAVSRDGAEIYVADPDTKCVHRYDLRRGNYRCLGFRHGGTLISPVGLAVRNDGRLFIADSQLQGIFTIAAKEKWLESFPIDVPLQQPTGIAWDDADNFLYITDTGSQSIKVVDADGALVREFGSRGDQPGQVNFPTNIWLDDRRDVLVADTLNFRVQRFGRDGRFRHAFGDPGDQPGTFARPKGVASDSFGHLYVVDALLHALQIFDRSGTFLLSVGGQGRAAGRFWLPNGVHVTGDNLILVADSYNRRVQVFRYIGTDL